MKSLEYGQKCTLEKLPQWKVDKIVATRCPILRQKCITFDFSWDPVREFTLFPQTPKLDLKGLTFKEWEGIEREGGEEEGTERVGGKEGEGKEMDAPFPNS